MILCSKCVLPESYPGIEFDENGVCNVCRLHRKEQEGAGNWFANEEELITVLSNWKGKSGKYDVLVPASGGVDSSFALVKLVETFGLRPLVYHNDHGYENETATENVRKLCRSLDVDLILWQYDTPFMKKLWKYLNNNFLEDTSACYVCGNMLYLNAIELACRFDIPLVVNGYSKGQADLIGDKEKGRERFENMMALMAQDRELFNELTRKYEYLGKQKIFSRREDLEHPDNDGRILVLPFFVFQFYKTDKDQLKEECRRRFDWRPQETNYPRRTTNCRMIWLNTHMDLKKMGYSVYHTEYSRLIREGEITREQALQDLAFDPPGTIVQELADDVGVDIHNTPASLRKVDAPAEELGEEEDFAF
jgi:hypothetical protein